MLAKWGRKNYSYVKPDTLSQVHCATLVNLAQCVKLDITVTLPSPFSEQTGLDFIHYF